MFALPFSYSTNGHEIAEFDFLTGLRTTLTAVPLTDGLPIPSSTVSRPAGSSAPHRIPDSAPDQEPAGRQASQGPQRVPRILQTGGPRNSERHPRQVCRGRSRPIHPARRARAPAHQLPRQAPPRSSRSPVGRMRCGRQSMNSSISSTLPEFWDRMNRICRMRKDHSPPGAFRLKLLP
jgi:hypothetical protein